MDFKEEAKGKLENLEERIRLLQSECRDRDLIEYLQKLSQRVIQQKYQADLLADELDRSLRMYQNRMQQRDLLEDEKTEEISQGDSQRTLNQMEENEMSDGGLPGQTASVQPTEAIQQPVRPQYTYVSANERSRPEPVLHKKSNTEFTVGAVLLSLLGGAFILAALVVLGVNYMNGFVRGMCLFAFSALFISVSELFLYRRWKMLGSVLTAVGIGGMYLSTVVNYLALHNFPAWTAMLITTGIMVFVVLLSRKRDSALYRALGLIACYLCYLPIELGITNAEFLAVTGMIFLVNVACALLPTRTGQIGISILQMISGAIFAQMFVWRAFWCGVFPVPRIVFVLSSFFVMQLLFIIMMRQKKSEEGVRIAYWISSVFYLAMIYFETAMYDGEKMMFYYGLMAGIAVICLLAFLALLRDGAKWHPYTLVNLTVIILAQFLGRIEGVIFLLALLAFAKLLSLRKPALLLKLNDAALTTIVCFKALAFRFSPDRPDSQLCGNLLFAGVLLSIFFIRYYRTYYQIILTYTIAIFMTFVMPSSMKLPIFTGVLLAGMLLFNNVKKWQGKNIILFNALALSGQIVCFLLLAWPGYRNAYFTYLFMLVFGLGTIILTFHEKYHMNFRCKLMIAAVFLTYLVLIVKIELPIIKSILLMLIALAGVAAGFVEQQKSVRIYGLVLSLVVCGKIVLYDFVDAPNLQRAILLFAAGAIALVIAGIYIILEKKNQESK